MSREKVSKGQINLLGDIYNYQLKYHPHKVTSKTGESIVVLRLPSDAEELDRLASHQEAQKLAGGVRTTHTRDYWYKKPRDKFRKKGLEEIVC